jgi:hypothetical protein
MPPYGMAEWVNGSSPRIGVKASAATSETEQSR